MRQFFITLRQSIWSPEFYEVMGSHSTRQGIRYFLSLMFFVSFVITVVVSVFVVPAAIFGANLASRVVSEHYPADLTITFKNGAVSAIPQKVYKLPVSSQIWSPGEIAKFGEMGISNMLVIDTESNFENVNKFNDAKTLVLLNKDSVVTKSNSGFEVKSLKEFPDITVTKTYVQNVISRLISSIKYIAPLLIVLGFIGLLVFISLMYLVLGAIAAVLMWALSGLSNRKGRYKEFFVASLYAVTLPVMLDLAIMVSGRSNFSFHYLTTILIIVLVWAFNVKIWKRTNLPMVKEPPKS